MNLVLLKNEAPKYVLRFATAILALAGSTVVGVIVFGLIGSVLFHKGFISDATSFVFPWYGVFPGFIAGAILYIKILVGKVNSK